MDKISSSTSRAVDGTNEVPDPEVSSIPKRRTFTGEYKQRILKEVEACAELCERQLRSDAV